MKKVTLLMASFTIALLNAGPQIVQPVVDITPDKPVMPMPTPPAEHLKATDLKVTTTLAKEVLKKPVKRKNLLL